ncbi:hypothetical protein F5Y15DRAFT_333638 [Xylariaceae sp. FL0016]|nr:hypothetical protein F5Y15DRAFT_333638 [Xylariaceae sp. FL0016]
MKTSLLLPASMAALTTTVLGYASAASPSIYVLMPSRPAATAVTDVLHTLGYSRSESPSLDGLAHPRADTYAVLAPGTEYMNISRTDPGAKFILPVEPASHARSGSWLLSSPKPDPAGRDADGEYADAVRGFFAANDVSRQQLLELDVRAPRPDMQAQTWENLCDFLGLGYSVVERFKLWRFP